MKVSRIIWAVALCFAAAVVQPSSSRAEDEEEGFEVVIGKDAKAFHLPRGNKRVKIVPAFEDYLFMVEDVCSSLSIKGDDCLIYTMNGEVSNALAAVIEGNKVIIYDRRLSGLVGSYEGAMGILAHEVAHHYCRHHFDVSKNNWQAELEADRFAGASFKRMKYPLEAALAMAVVLDERPSTSHPPADLRRKAIEAGWNKPETGKMCRST
ncbi:M48 family metalloprotease [Microvirga sp. BSC39]|uniref:M48 family metalloprotease n=1 Tax=Microvirga sp. BSC39 TaxID=1549810 RepID=UPI001269D6A8|nr:M48 family metalloprotease [Microvirga sp. BSC39]